MFTSLADSLYAFFDFDFSMLPKSQTSSGEPISSYLEGTEAVAGAVAVAGELFNLLCYMIPLLVLLLWKGVIWFFMGTGLLNSVRNRPDIAWACWVFNLNFLKLFIILSVILSVLNIYGLYVVWGLESMGFLIDPTDFSILFSANPSASDSVEGTDGTPGDSSSIHSLSTSIYSPGTHTHNKTSYGTITDAVAQAACYSAIMAGYLAAGFLVAKQFPTIQVKMGAVLTSLVAGGSAIATKTLIGYFSQYIGKRYDSNKLVSIPTFEDLNTQIMQAFNFTDDYLSNFLQLIAISHKLQWFCVTMIGYYAILLYVPIEKLETFYHRLLPIWLADKIIKSVRVFKKTGVFLFVIFYGLLVFSLYLADLNLAMILQHYEDLCQYHINKTK
jgi:hypothetical protein